MYLHHRVEAGPSRATRRRPRCCTCTIDARPVLTIAYRAPVSTSSLTGAGVTVAVLDSGIVQDGDRELREIERESSGEFSAADAIYQLGRIIEVVREVVPPEYHAAIADRLDIEPTSPPPSSDPVWDEIAEELGEDAFR